MGVSTHKAIRIVGLSAAFASLLALANGCGASPGSTGASVPASTPEPATMQNIRPTSEPVATQHVAPTSQPATTQSVPPTPAPAIAQNVPPTPPLTTAQLPAGAQTAPGVAPSKPRDCPGLDSQLYQISQAPDPIKLAEQAGLRVKQDKIQVLLIVTREDVQFSPTSGVEVGSRAGTQVQAFVPIGQLCALANMDDVLAIRRPAQAIPQ